MSRLAVLSASLLALAALAGPAVAGSEILGPDAAACAPGSGKDAVLLTIDGFKNRQGTVRVEMWPGTDGDFMRNHHELVAEGKPYYRATVAVPAAGAARVCVPLPGAGTYAVGAFHSPEGVRKFNFRQDGATFTRNPKMGLSKPKASEVAMRFGTGVSESHVTLNYLRGLGFRPIPAAELQTTDKR
ncbi:DUF2141 domain-containing protein [Sandaracinobacteroides hominis]|uniref:DUF2141 domain-containing protein n=1 Tax=Sandaracinobacteroides hominis TaxID=2780086 RepID=UPI0018F3FEF4|nr:DUF2141 domain-containing protein [Sandaracinobacteroides hominis]